jgi:hypothetical protein
MGSVRSHWFQMTKLHELLAQLEPVRQLKTYAFCTLSIDQTVPASTVGWFREAEGMTIILPLNDALGQGLQIVFQAAWITLTVHSALDAVGLTAAVSTALTQAGISCNVVAAVHHDHLFVPINQAEQAMDVLKQLQQSARAANAD